ncbi:MAG: YchJ family protein [Gammaproteobacteria bacterium]
MAKCHCNSGLDFDNCCGPVLAGERPAATAEELMRSRYSAYVCGEIDYLAESLHPEHRSDYDAAATRRWANNADWLGLEIRSTKDGGESDTEGEVEFIANYRDNGVSHTHHEISRFKKEAGRWYYVDGDTPKVATYKKEQPKVGRNEPCPCGSGKKYKKCCG